MIRNNKIKFDRNEFAGAFGDLGTDLPLVVGLILTCKLNSSSVLIGFGLAQIFTGLVYRIPMPVQPLKAMAVIAITHGVASNVLYGGGLAIGITMLLLTVTGLLSFADKFIPKVVVRGIQFGLSLSLMLLATRDYILKSQEGTTGIILAVIGVMVTGALIGNRKYPPAILLVGIGIIYSLMTKNITIGKPELNLPTINLVGFNDIISGFLLLSLPQIPLSLANSIYSTKQIASDLFPEKQITTKKLGYTYSLMNIISTFISSIPVCHGSGGMAGHYAFGARTGGSVVIEGSFYLLLGLFFSSSFDKFTLFFPMPILGVILLFEGFLLLKLLKDSINTRKNIILILAIGITCVFVKYGYLIGFIGGTITYYLFWNQKLKSSA